MDRSDRPRGPWILGLVIAVITAGVAAALITSEESGTGATDVGDRGDAGGRPDPGSDSGAGNQAGSGGAGRPARSRT